MTQARPFFDLAWTLSTFSEIFAFSAAFGQKSSEGLRFILSITKHLGEYFCLNSFRAVIFRTN